MNQTDKINKALKIIYNYLPSTYPKVKVKIYKSVYSMVKAEAKYCKMTYNETAKYYNKRDKGLEKSSQNYIKTKYYKPKYPKSHCHPYLHLNITAISSNPIAINLENTKHNTLKNYIFLLLHEIGHSYYKPKGKNHNEHLCDLFAIRWYKRINAVDT